MINDELPPSYENSTVTDVFPREPAEKSLDDYGVEKIKIDDIYSLGGVSSALSEVSEGKVFDYFYGNFLSASPNESQESFEMKVQEFLNSDEFELRIIPPQDAAPLEDFPHRFQILISAGDLAFVAKMPASDIARLFPMELPAGDAFDLAKSAYEKVVNSEGPAQNAENYLNYYRVVDGLWKRAALEYDPAVSANSFGPLERIMNEYVVKGRRLEVTDRDSLANFVFDNNRLPTWVEDFSVAKEEGGARLEGPGEDYYTAKIVVDNVLASLETAISLFPHDASEKQKAIEISKAGDQFRVLCEKLDVPFARAFLFPLAKKISEQGPEYAASIRDAVFSIGFGGEEVFGVWEKWGLKFDDPDHTKMIEDDTTSF